MVSWLLDRLSVGPAVDVLYITVNSASRLLCCVLLGRLCVGTATAAVLVCRWGSHALTADGWRIVSCGCITLLGREMRAVLLLTAQLLGHWEGAAVHMYGHLEGMSGIGG
jgi:hypothetical protein